MTEEYQEVKVDGDAGQIDITSVSLEEAKDVVQEWVNSIGGTIRDDYHRFELAWVRPNPWNPNSQDEFMYAHQLEVMRQTGQVAPIIVREVGPDNDAGQGQHDEEHYQIVDGEHRWRAAGDLGWNEISVNNLGVVPDTVAQMITVIMNHVRGESDPLSLGRLFKGMREEAAGDREKLDRMTRWMPFRDRDIDVLVDAVREDKKVAAIPDRLRHTKDFVSFKFRVPKDAAVVCTRALETVIATGNCTTDRAFELICADYLAGADVQIDSYENDEGEDDQ